MSATVDQAWVYRFHDQILLTYQQMGSQLEGLIDQGMVHRNVSAAIDHHERLGLVMANDVVNPFGQTIVLNPPHSRRAATLVSSDATVLVSDEHTLRSMANPQSPYTRTIVGAIGRRADKHIIDALGGNSTSAAVTSGSGVITYGSVALPSSQKIGTGVAITLVNIIQAHQKLSKNGVPVGPGVRKMLYSPGQEQDIMAITQASSSDFTKNQIHDRGTIDGLTWQGFHWVSISDEIQIDLSVVRRMLPLTSTNRKCYAFHTGAVGLSIGRPVGAPTIATRYDLQSDPLQIKQKMMQVATRVFEGGVVELSVLEN